MLSQKEKQKLREINGDNGLGEFLDSHLMEITSLENLLW